MSEFERPQKQAEAVRNRDLRIRRDRAREQADHLHKVGDRLAWLVKCLTWVGAILYGLIAISAVAVGGDPDVFLGFLLGGFVVMLSMWVMLDVANFVRAMGRASASTLMMTCDRYEAEVPLPETNAGKSDS